MLIKYLDYVANLLLKMKSKYSFTSSEICGIKKYFNYPVGVGNIFKKNMGRCRWI